MIHFVTKDVGELLCLSGRMIFFCLLLLGIYPLQAQETEKQDIPSPMLVALGPEQGQKQDLKKVLQTLEKKYAVRFYFDPTLLEGKTTTIKEDNNDLEAMLIELLTPYQLNFKKLDENSYVIRENDPKSTIPKLNTKEIGKIDVLKGVERQQLSGIRPLQPLEQTITGQITDGENSEPLPGVNVLAKGTTTGTVTDVDGNYRLTVSDDVKTLVISSIGYITEEVEINGRSTIDLGLMPDIKALSEVVVVGYGTQKKSDLTGAVSQLDGKVLEERATLQLSQALQGTVPGLMVTRSGSDPNQSATIRIRGVTTIGTSDPLVLIDGIPGSLDRVNSNDVESISVLKDAASASIYGSRAAAGVILVTTKRAEKGSLKFNYSYQYGIENVNKVPQSVNAQEYMQIYNERFWNDNGNDPNFEYTLFSQDLVENYFDLNRQDPDQYPITDWNALMLRGNAPRQNHSLNLMAGGEHIRTKAAIDYQDVQGVYVGRNYQRITFRVNNNFKINDIFSGIVDVSGFHAEDDAPLTKLTPNSAHRGPIYAAYYADGRVAEGLAGVNSWADIALGGSNIEKQNSFMGRLGLDFTPVDGLKITGIFSPTLTFTSGKNFSKKIPYYTYNDPDNPIGFIDGHSTTNLIETREEVYSYITQIFANYQKQFGSSDLEAMVGYENYYTIDSEIGARRNNYFLDDYPYLDLGNSNFQYNNGGATELAYRSVFGRLIYNFQDKYSIQFNGRYDASSRFAKPYRGAFFPSVSAGWTISEESFMDNVQWINFFKIRGSWGMLGNERIGDNYPYQSTIGFTTSGVYNGSTPVLTQAAAVNRYAIPDISWETTESFDIGADLAFFEGRINVVFDYYKKTTKDMLLELEIPSYIGLDNPNQNAGSMYTEGWEFQTTFQNRIGKLGYNISFNLSDSKSVMGDLKGTEFIGNKIKIEGSEFDEWYGYQSDGLFQTQAEVDEYPTINENVGPGDIKLLDISGPNGVPDGMISPEYDRTLLGGSLPRFLYGVNLRLDYKGFDLSAFVQGVGKQLAQTPISWVEPYTIMPELTKGKYWSHYRSEQENLNALYPRVSGFYRTNNYSSLNNFWLFNGGYLRLKNVILGYTLPESLLSKIKISNLRVFATGSDIFSISKFPDDRDPEGSSNFITSTYMIGVSVDF